jgi:Tfp pilus assembly protein PilF
MNIGIEDPTRRLVPRWRDALVTIGSGELAPVGQASPARRAIEDGVLAKRLNDWRQNRSLPFAADLVAAAVVLQEEDAARDAAEFLLDSFAELPLATRRLAERVLGRELTTTSDTPVAVERVSIEKFGQSVEYLRHHPANRVIHGLKKRLAEEPRNALLWADLARRYTILGLDDRARRAIFAALSQAPDDRFILRSAARFFVHVDEPDLAHRILRRSAATRRDPWLLSAEIAVADVAGKTSNFVTHGRRLLQDHGLAAAHLSELAGSIASLELGAGKIRQARRLFAQALIDPTENTVAQVEWASRRAKEITIEHSALTVPRSYEARAWEAYRAEEWQTVVDQSEEWFTDEPFSGRPIALGTYTASVILEDYERAESLARMWLALNPNDQHILNNLAFILASGGKVAEAMEVLRHRNLEASSSAIKVAWTATGGLIDFRRGNIAQGRAQYESAVEMASRADQKSWRASAIAFWAREEALAGTNVGQRLLETAKSFNDEVDSETKINIRVIAGRIAKILRDDSLRDDRTKDLEKRKPPVVL